MKWSLGFVPLALAVLAQPAAAQDVGYAIIGVKIGVADYQKPIDFYALLGMKLGPKHNAAEWELDAVDPAQKLRLIMVHDETGRMKLAPGGAFLMISVPNVTAVAAKLKAAGHAGIGDPRAAGNYAILMVRDPDGNQLEILGPMGQ